MATEHNRRQKPYSKGQTKNTKGKPSGIPSSKRKTSGDKRLHNHRIEEDTNKALFQNEIILIVSLVLSLLLILSNFNLSGKVGEYINIFTFGMFGFLAYLLPFFLFFGVAFYIANRGNKVAIRRLISGISLGIIVTAFIQLIFVDYNGSTKIGEYFANSAKEKNGGGIIGGILCKLLHSLFGNVGTFIILIALMIVCLMFITGKALFAYLGTKSQTSLQQIKERKRIREEEYLAQQQESGVETTERRPARTVLLKKRQTESTISDIDPINNQDEILEDGFLNIKKKKKIKNKNISFNDLPLVNLDNAFDMEEIKSIDPDSIPIQRGGTYQGVTSTVDKNKTYEKQLDSKFGKYLEPAEQSKDPNKERPGLDDDINRLLQAAEQDQVSSAQDQYTVSSEEPLIDASVNKPALGKSMSVEKNEKIDTEQLNINQIIQEKKEYVFPPIDLLSKPKADVKGMSDKDLKETAIKLQKTLESFGVRVTITNVSCGPAVTRYELQPEQGVKVSRITGLADDIKLNLAAADVRIEAPIPGKAAVGIEVPNKETSMVMFRELIENKNFMEHPSDIAFAVGKDIGGQTIVTDIAKMPHLLIAGATGSGKSVCINTLIMSILYKANPSDVRMIMVDPKVVELSVYNGIPHLLIPVVTDPKKASAALNWAVMEMTERYSKFADIGVRDLKGYNEKIATVAEYKDEKYQKLPQIVIIVDELADLMMVAPGEVEEAICRLAQMARAAGLHLIVATQRPSVNVITGLIKANIPSRIAFSVTSSIDSRTIIDGSGAEKLLGKGDMLFYPSGYPKPIRVQGAFVSDQEVSAVVEFLTSKNNKAEYSEEITNKITNAQVIESPGSSSANERDDYFLEAGKFIIDKDKASIGMLQRVYKIGFNRAARIMDQLADAGVVGQEEGTKPRKVLMSLEEFEQFVDEYA